MLALATHGVMHHMHDDVELALAEHTGPSDGIIGGHTGRGLVRERAWTHAHHDQSIRCSSTPRAVLAWKPAGEETSEMKFRERGRVSKIRARQSTRNDEIYTATAADRGASATREQEVFGRKPCHDKRHNPVRAPYP